MKTPFYELAEKIAEQPTYFLWGMMIMEEQERKFFNDLFYVDQHIIIFRHRQCGETNEKILALLFADMLWQDEMKGGKK